MIRPLRIMTVTAVALLSCLSAFAQLQLEQGLLKRAATGDATAMHLIGRAAAAEGKPVEAYAWFILASEYGVETSEKVALSNTLNATQLAGAAQRVMEIKSKLLQGLPPPPPKPAVRVVDTKPAVVERPVAAPVTSPARPEPVLDSRIAAQASQITRLEADLAASRAEVRDSRNQADESIRRLETALAGAHRERDALAEEIASLRRDKQRAEESLAQIKAQPAMDAQVEAQKAQIAKLETDIAAARAEIGSANAKSDQATDRLEAALAQTGRERDALTAEIATLRKEKQLAEESLAQLKSRPSLEGQVQAQKAQISKLEADIAAMRNERQTAESARDQIRAELSATRTRLEADLVAARAEASAAKAKAGEATKLETALAQATRDRDSLTGEIATLRHDKQRAEESLAQLKVLPSLEAQVQSQKAQIAKLETDLASAQSAARAAKAQSDEANTKLEAALALATKERGSLSTQVAALRREKESAEASLAQLQSRPTLDAQVEAQKAQIAKLESDLAAARADARDAMARADESAARLAAAPARSATDAESHAKEIATLKQERLAAEQARDRMRAELATARTKLEADLAAARNEARVAKAYAAKLEADLVAVRSESRSGGAQFGEPSIAMRTEPLRPSEPERADIPAPALPRIHAVASGETLSSISLRYYGTPNRWEDIFNANRDVLNSPNQLALGTRLRIP